MLKRRVCIVLTSRGNYGKMKSVIQEVRSHPQLELKVVIGGSLILEKYGKILNDDAAMEFPIDAEVHFLIEGETPLTMAKSAGIAVSEFSNVFDSLKPDVVIVIADRYECLSITMAATYMNIPIVHIEGGELSGSIDESIRHAITKMAHLHFPCSDEAKERIIRMGEHENTVFKAGATSFDVLATMDLSGVSFMDNYQLEHGVGTNIDIKEQEYLIVIQHPVTTEYEKSLLHVDQTIKAIDELEIPTFWLWPNMDAGSDGISKAIRIYRETYNPAHVHFFKSLPIEFFAPLLNNAACIIGNSSSGIREAAFLGTPTVNIGTRQTGRARAENVIDVDYDKDEIMKAIKAQVKHKKYQPNHMYGDGNAAKIIVEKLMTFDFKQQKINRY